MLDKREIDFVTLDEEMSAYRRRFSFEIPENVQCILFEENQEFSVKIYRAIKEKERYNFEKEKTFFDAFKERDKLCISFERQGFSLNQNTYVRLFSERVLASQTTSDRKNDVYYTLQVCDKEGSFALFRAFSANKSVANRLFEKLCSWDTSSSNAIDFYREARLHVLRELWFFGF